jgi:hypothetical protein
MNSSVKNSVNSSVKPEFWVIQYLLFSAYSLVYPRLAYILFSLKLPYNNLESSLWIRRMQGRFREDIGQVQGKYPVDNLWVG